MTPTTTPDEPGPHEPGPDEPGPDEPGPDEPGPDEPDASAPRPDSTDADSEPRTDEPADAADPPSDEEGGSGGREMAVAGSGRRPPPRRTGVFVDADELRTYVGGLLRAILGGYEVDQFGNFSFTHDGARVYVSVGATPVGLAVNVHAVTNVGLELDQPLATFLATTNHRLGFGALSWDTDNDAVWLRHTLLGTTLDAPELQAAVATVAQTAAAIDDDIKQRFGGRTFDEAPADVRAATAPPTSATSPPSDGSDDEPVEGVRADNASGYL